MLHAARDRRLVYRRHDSTVDASASGVGIVSVKPRLPDGERLWRTFGERRGGTRASEYDRPVKTTLERELKLDVEPGFALPDLGGSRSRAHLHLHVLRHRRPAAAPLRDHAAATGRAAERRVAAQAPLGERPVRARAARRPGASARTRSCVSCRRFCGRALRSSRPRSCGRAGAASPSSTRAERIEVRSIDVAVLDGGGKVATTFAELEAEVVDGRRRRAARDREGAAKGGRAPSDGGPKLRRALALPEQPGPRAGGERRRRAPARSCSSTSTRR